MARANPPPSSLGCCVPLDMSDTCTMEPIIRTSLLSMAKVICTSSSCTESGFIHPECFARLEKSLVRYVSIHVLNVKKYNWGLDTVKENLWKDLIYHWIMKQVKCNCGHGYLRKDIGWPPLINRRKSVRKVKSKVCSNLPQLNSQKGGKVSYVPTVVPEYPREMQSSSDVKKSIPGAVFVEKVMMKRGLVVTWKDGVGQVRNLNNKDERLCTAMSEVVEGVEIDMEDMVGSEVEYQTEKRGKKLVAVMVRVVRRVEWKKGMVTHWVPEELAGVIMSEKEEVLVYRREFVAGGFAPDIVGKTVKFKLDKLRLEATFVQVVVQEEELYSSDMENNNLLMVDQEDLAQYPQLAHALSNVNRLVSDMGSMDKREQSKLLDQLEKFIPTLAAHPRGYKMVVGMVCQFKESLLDRVVRILSRKFIALSEVAAGAKCLLDSLTHLPRELQQSLMIAYSSLTDSQEAVDHMTGQNSFIVFAAALPLLNASLVKQLVKTITPGLAVLAGHESLLLLVEHTSNTDHELLVLLANQLDAEHLLLLPEQSALVIHLLSTGNVRVCGLVLHHLSGRLPTLLLNNRGRDLVRTFILSATDLQVELVMEELCDEPENRVPLIVTLAVECGDQDEFVEAVVRRARREVLERMLDIFKQFRETMIASDTGRRWIGTISKKVNTDKD